MRKCRNLTPRLLCGRTLFGIRDPAYFNQRLSIFIDGTSGVGFQWPAMAFAGRLRPKQNFNSPKNFNLMQFIDRLNYINNFHLNIDKICVKFWQSWDLEPPTVFAKSIIFAGVAMTHWREVTQRCVERERGGEQLFNQLNWWLELFKLKWKVIILRFVFEIRNLASEYFPSKFSHNAQWNTIRFTCFILTLKRIEFWLKSTITTN